MFKQKIEHRRLISCLIISIIIIFLNNNSVVDSNTIACSNEEYETFQLTKATISSHIDHYAFLEAWDAGDGQDVVIDGSGNVYKTNQNDGVDIYDSNGNYITLWTGGGVLGGTCGLIFDSKWNLYVVNQFNNQIAKLDSQGNFVLAWGSEGEGDGEFKMPNRIACDSQDNIYVADHDLNRIQKFDSSGNFIKSWNLPYGDGGGCIGLAIDSQDYVYVAAEFFLKYNVDGNLIKEWGTPLTNDGSLNGPHGLTVDSLDALYVTEIGTPRVQKFDSDGGFITEFGSSDGGQGQLNHPLGITVAANGLVYVIDAGNGQIQIYTPSITEPTVIFPNGGETLNGIVEIQWTPSNDPYNHSVTYSVYYSVNNGASWNLLISGLSTTNYNWDITSLLYGVDYRIRVVASCSICSTGYTSEDTSDDTFTILGKFPPPILMSPTRETVLRGSITIRWSLPMDMSELNLTYTVSYSTDNGTSWTTLISNLTTTSYSWDTTTVADGSNYLIKVTVYTSGGLAAYTISDGTFAINNRSSLIYTIILPILIALVFLGLLFWINRLVLRNGEEL
ncbi:MAG: 6-bladed beta-propeller [Candidatus Hermodarchaeota archaeon]